MRFLFPRRFSLLAISQFRFLAFALVCFAGALQAETGDDNPTGVSGIFNGNVTTGGSYDPFTGNAMRVVDDIVVPGTLGTYPLKWTRYWNSRGPDRYHPGGWRYSYISYAFDADRAFYTFPDGRVISFDEGEAPGIEERCDSTGITLADGGRVIFQATPAPPPGWGTYQLVSQIIDPYGNITDIEYGDPNKIYRATKIKEPKAAGAQSDVGRRYLQITYNASDEVTRVEAYDGVSSTPTQSVDYIWADFPLDSPANQTDTLNHVSYSDGTSADYQYRQIAYAPSAITQPPTDPWHAPALFTCDDTRFAGPMRQISYQYDGHPRMVSENHAIRDSGGNLIAGEVVSSITGAGQQTSTPVETRGDGATRTFTYGGPGSGGKLSQVTDFLGHPTNIGYGSDPNYPGEGGFITSVTDPNGHKTSYERHNTPSSWGITKITHEVDGSTILQSFTDPANPYYLASRTDELNHKTDYTRDLVWPDPKSWTGYKCSSAGWLIG